MVVHLLVSVGSSTYFEFVSDTPVVACLGILNNGVPFLCGVVDGVSTYRNTVSV